MTVMLYTDFHYWPENIKIILYYTIDRSINKIGPNIQGSIE